MSAGSLIGTVANIIFFAIFWTILGVAVDKIGYAFNMSIRTIPTFQDAVNGFTMTQQVFWLLPAIVAIVLLIDHVLTENSKSSGEV
jgi:hypothetical protein